MVGKSPAETECCQIIFTCPSTYTCQWARAKVVKVLLLLEERVVWLIVWVRVQKCPVCGVEHLCIHNSAERKHSPDLFHALAYAGQKHQIISSYSYHIWYFSCFCPIVYSGKTIWRGSCKLSVPIFAWQLCVTVHKTHTWLCLLVMRMVSLPDFQGDCIYWAFLSIIVDLGKIKGIFPDVEMQWKWLQPPPKSNKCLHSSRVVSYLWATGLNQTPTSVKGSLLFFFVKQIKIIKQMSLGKVNG